MSIPVPPGICVEWDQRDPSRAGSCLLCSWPGVLHSSEAGGEELKCDVPVLSRRLAYNFPVQGWIGGHVCHFSSIHTYHEQFPVYTVTTYCSCSFTQTTTNCNVFLFYCLFHKHLIFGLYCVHAPSPPHGVAMQPSLRLHSLTHTHIGMQIPLDCHRRSPLSPPVWLHCWHRNPISPPPTQSTLPGTQT